MIYLMKDYNLHLNLASYINQMKNLHLELHMEKHSIHLTPSHCILIYLFATVLVVSAAMVVTIRNPVKAALFLVLSFFSAACIWMTLEAEFLSIALVLVYVGAVMVRFLFVVMMLDVDFAELKAEMARYMPLALLIGLVILMQFVMAFGAWDANSAAEGLRTQVITDEVHNTAALGLILYDQYFLLFQLSGLILLVAMIGAIVLTLRHRADVKRQNVVDQMMRDPKLAMKLNDVKPGQGL